jgi:hypothetical protein
LATVEAKVLLDLIGAHSGKQVTAASRAVRDLDALDASDAPIVDIVDLQFR